MSQQPTPAPRTPRTPRKPPDHPLIDALHLLSGKWAMHVLFHMNNRGGPMRFSELQRLIPQVTAKELTKRLRELERAGLVKRTVHAEVPPRVEYLMTPLCTTLVEPLTALTRWAEAHATEIARHWGDDP